MRFHDTFFFCHSRFKCFDPAVAEQPSYPDDVVSDPDNRVAFVFSKALMKFIAKERYRSGVMSVYEADEDTLPFYMGYKMHIALKDIVTLKLSQYVENGIIQKKLKTLAMENFRAKPEEIGLQVLTFSHLRAGFILIFALLSVSVLVFLVECGPNLAKKLFDWCLSCYIVMKFTRMNRVP
jgi:hypothetical protein